MSKFESVPVGGVMPDGRPYITAKDVLEFQLWEQMDRWRDFFVKDPALDVWFGPAPEKEE